jgi:hypothetical protein
MTANRTPAGTAETVDLPVGKPYVPVELPPLAERIAVGEVVGIDHPKYPGRWTIAKVNARSCTVERGGQSVRVDRSMLIVAPAADTGPVRPEGVRAGAVIRVDVTRYRGVPADGLMVVLDTRGDKIKAAPLGGGARDSCWKIADQHIAEVIPAARITVAP